MQSTVPALEGNWILFSVLQVRFGFFFLIYPELIFPAGALNGCAVALAASFGEATILIFFQETSSILIKSILNLCDFLKYYLHHIFKAEGITCSKKSSILLWFPAKEV